MRLAVELDGAQRERFWERVTPTGFCWEWDAPTEAGYGYVSFSRKLHLAHRVAYELLMGAIPSTLELDHLCRNKSCVNPDHLDPVTHKVNMLRAMRYRRRPAAATHCRRGHEFTQENTRVTSQGKRLCRTCRSAYNRAYEQQRNRKEVAS